MIIRTESQMIKALEIAKGELKRWDDKTPEFWAAWQGKDKATIIKGWQNVVNKFAAQLNEYYVRIGSDKVAQHTRS